MWSEGHVWCSPEMHGTITGAFKNQIDWCLGKLSASFTYSQKFSEHAYYIFGHMTISPSLIANGGFYVINHWPWWFHFGSSLSFIFGARVYRYSVDIQMKSLTCGSCM